MSTHHLIVTKGDDWFPDQPDYKGEIVCVEPEKCNGYMECQEPHEVDGVSASEGPDGDDPELSCPGWHGPYTADQEHNKRMKDSGEPHFPWCDERVFEFHGVMHEWHYGFGWTVPWPGCVVAGADNAECINDIGIEHGEGTFVVDDEWGDPGDCYLIVAGLVTPAAVA